MKYRLMHTFLLIWNLSEACRGLNFISTKTRVLSNLCHMCIQARYTEPCCVKCDMCFIRGISWPLTGKKRTKVFISTDIVRVTVSSRVTLPVTWSFLLYIGWLCQYQFQMLSKILKLPCFRGLIKYYLTWLVISFEFY